MAVQWLSSALALQGTPVQSLVGETKIAHAISVAKKERERERFKEFINRINDNND